MITDALNGLRAIGTSIVEALLLPGHLIIDRLVDLAPEIFSTVGITANDGSVLYTIAALFWLLVILASRAIFSFANNLRIRYLRYKEAICFRLSIEWRFFRQKLNHFAGIFGGNHVEPIVEPPRVDFDKLDIDVLEFIDTKGAGFAVSAPEIAEVMRMRPSEIQARLDKLTRSTMLQSVIGSTDGYENFRLTPAGETYASMLRGKTPVSATPNPEAATPHDDDFIPDGIHLSG